jgi:sugar phosphate isomerase/epimerase
MRSVTLFTAQFADIPLEILVTKAREWGFDGVELGGHLDIRKASTDQTYCQEILTLLSQNHLKLFAISAHLVGQAVCDHIDERRHRAILPAHVWGDGESEGVKQRAAKEVIAAAYAAKNLGIKIVNGFTGSSIWHLLYGFPPINPDQITEGYQDFAQRWTPILNEYKKCDIHFALEVHPSEIAFDIVSAERTLEAIDNHPSFGFNFDPSHLAYQGVDYIEFLRRFKSRIFHVHMKDVDYDWNRPCEAGVFGGHTMFGDPRRFFNFRSLGRGKVDFERIIRTLNQISYEGPLSVEWEDGDMDREIGAQESLQFVRRLDFKRGDKQFDAAFSQ